MLIKVGILVTLIALAGCAGQGSTPPVRENAPATVSPQAAP